MYHKDPFKLEQIRYRLYYTSREKSMEKNKKTTMLLLVLGIIFLAAGVVMLTATWGVFVYVAIGPLSIGAICSTIAAIRWWKEN